MLAACYLARYPQRFMAYSMLQLRLMEIFVTRGGSAELWIEKYAAPFRKRYAFMLAE